MAAALPGVVAALTPLPVLGVPCGGSAFGGFDALLSIVQMPAGVPVATFAVGRAGAVNAAIFAAAMLALADLKVAEALARFRAEQSKRVTELPL
jgi:5-(carboxyamino)imidazole ribonucleotide mutase